MSHITMPIVAPTRAVSAPMPAMNARASGVKNGYIRPTMNTPAATIVAAWISAETGVGPAIASGSQTCSGTWADFEIAPQKIRMPDRVSIPWFVRPSHE